MLSKNKQSPLKNIPSNILLSDEEQSSIFYRINIEYFCLYCGLNNSAIKQGMLRGLTNNLIGMNADLRRKSKQWEQEHNTILEDLALKLTLEVKRQHRHLPITALKRFSPDTEELKRALIKTPNDPLCHFHLAWLYSLSNNHILAEKHFNIAALQSQNSNTDFSCFAYRHLAHTRVKNGKIPQALLAIEAACTQSKTYNPELLFERVRLLSRANKTTQALPYMAHLIKKNIHYSALASQDFHIQKTPFLKRFFDQEKERHIKNIKHQVIQHWKNDPLHLLNLDAELGQRNSRQIILNKQAELILKLPTLMVFNEAISSKLIQSTSRAIIVKSLNIRKQQFIQQIEKHQKKASKAHNTGQWMVYTAIIGLISLGLSYAVSSLAYQFNYHLPVNFLVQSIVLSSSIASAIVGVIFLHFTPNKLSDLLKQKQRIETLSLRFGLSNG